jgi:uncharacterized protein YcfL
MKKILLLILLVAVFLVGCTSSIQDIKENPDKYVGETISVKGISSASVKLGQLSGFTLTEKSGSKISVSSENLPKDGSDVKVKGVVMKDSLFGVYILAKEVN